MNYINQPMVTEFAESWSSVALTIFFGEATEATEVTTTAASEISLSDSIRITSIGTFT